MTNIYMVRHCEAMGNVKRLFQGSTDLDISETGEKQLEYLKRRFEEIKLDRVYTSPLIRAYKTALAIIGERNLKPEINDGLREMSGGIVEGKPFKEAFNAEPMHGTTIRRMSRPRAASRCGMPTNEYGIP